MIRILFAAALAAAPAHAAETKPVAPHVAVAAAANGACLSPAIGKDVPYAVGEKLQFEFDSLGATVGTFTMTVLPGRGDDAYIIEARGKTGTFASNFYPVEAVAESHEGKALDNHGYVEDATENGVRRTVEIALPVPKDHKLSVRATKEGNREDYTLDAPDETRDLIATLYAVRAMNLPDGAELCLPVFAGRRVWTLRARVAGREPVRTPAGDFKTIHVEGTATRNDKPELKREVHFWLSDDAARTPVAAFGLVQNKPVRAQLLQLDPGRRKVAQGPRR